MSRESIFQYFAKEGKRLQHYVLSKMNQIDEMDAEDIVDDVMLSLLRVMGLNGQVENIPAYAMRTLQHKMVDYFRTTNRTTSLDTPISADEEASTLLEFMESNDDIESEYEDQEFMVALYEVLDSLDPKQRAIYIATEIEGRSFKELSEAWQEPIGTLLSRKSRVMKLLRERLVDYNPTE